MNRVENPKVLNPLYNLLDDQRAVWLDEMEQYLVVAPGIIFFATANEGWEFSGVDPIDKALKDRFEPVTVDYSPEDIQVQILTSKTGVDFKNAAILVQWANILRNRAPVPIPVSLRQILHAARDIVFGATLRESVQFSVIGAIPQESRESALQALQPIDPDFDKYKSDGWEPYA